MASNSLFDALENLPNISKKQAELLRKLGLSRVIDVIFFFPRDYEDFSEIRDIKDLVDSESTSVIGEVSDFELTEMRGGRSAFYLLLEQDGHVVRAVWFNQPYRARKIAVGKKIMLSGKTKLNGLRYEMTHPRMTILEEGEWPTRGSLLPVYRLTEGLKQTDLRRLVHQTINDSLDQVDEIFSEDYLLEKNLVGIQDALRKVHGPERAEDIDQGRRRLVFQELLTLQLAVQLRKSQVRKQHSAPILAKTAKIDSRIKKYFPFELTSAQLRAIDDIACDMGRSIPMNRMLHGDVGCGKTVVAVYALLLAVAHGQQGVLMAPTETLARQHFRNLQNSLVGSQVEIELLTGTLSKKEKQKTIGKIETGKAAIIVGTQALLQAEINFQNLGLIIVDEQHRFGVKQRATLRQKGMTPHYLVMTATPIPRTVAMTLFGDLDVSVIDEKPPQRSRVNTYLCQEDQKEKWWDFVRQKLLQGRQAYVIAPLVEENEQSGLESVEETFESLANGEFADFRIDLVHGGQSAEEKDQAMRNFANGQTQVLVATSVVEVGIDVPNATMMTILSAGRFGISQLHQLRGRVGRGQFAGYVALFSENSTEETQQRLQALVDTEDGFRLAEIDFQMRGPGDLFGTRQHGMPPLFVADLQRDFELLIEAKNDAERILSDDPGLDAPHFTEIKNRVLSRYGKTLNLGDVG